MVVATLILELSTTCADKGSWHLLHVLVDVSDQIVIHLCYTYLRLGDSSVAID
jgi:hypothetical protein